MGEKYSEISDRLTRFIEKQKIFFVGTAAQDGKVNVSPKGMDTLRVIDKNRIIWLNVTGSGNETAAHIQESPRMTLMFCSFEGKPMILRLYGESKEIRPDHKEWEALYQQFKPLPGARQIFDLAVDLVHTTCGMSVPYFNYAGERDELNRWAKKRGKDGIKEYWNKENRQSIDGKPIKIIN